MESEAGDTGRGPLERALEPGERRLQREVLALVMVEQPVALTSAEIARTLGAGPPVMAAIEALVERGLLRDVEDEVLPTPAAIRFHEIEPIEPPTDV